MKIQITKSNKLLIYYAVLFLTLTIGLTTCISCGAKNPNLTSKENTFIKNSVRVWKSIDITADALYTILGDLYKNNKITEEQKEKAIEYGKILKRNQELTKDAIVAYLWAAEINSQEDNKLTSENVYKERVINSLALSTYSFYDVKKEVISVYNNSTGESLTVPDIFISETLREYLNKEEK